ncbi:proteoglycan 4 [Plakobranchus ocellatus]|uniref:Proteoglycan 4 n=1 Tax=Plakobranchus ocellatus TaxID=259542 RepID=A0AAV4DT52_9GAST|nr:proteoglycan 4 [Plakobranchus ocellatus]
MSFPNLGLVLIFVLAASAQLQDTSNSINLYALVTQRFGGSLQIRCDFNGARARIRFVRSLAIERSEIESDGEYSMVATLTPRQVTYGEDITGVVAAGRIGRGPRSQLEITYRSATDGYCQLYRCVAEGVSRGRGRGRRRTQLRSIYKTIQVNAIDGGSCATTPPPTTTTTLPPTTTTTLPPTTTTTPPPTTTTTPPPTTTTTPPPTTTTTPPPTTTTTPPPTTTTTPPPTTTTTPPPTTATTPLPTTTATPPPTTTITPPPTTTIIQPPTAEQNTSEPLISEPTTSQPSISEQNTSLPSIFEQTTSQPPIDELEQTSEDIKNTTEIMREFEEELNEYSLIKTDVEKNQQEIDALYQQFSNVSLELEQVQENTEQIERNTEKFEEVYILLNAFMKILSLDKGQYEISSIFQGRVYIASRGDTVFGLYTMNQICITEGGYLVELDSEDEQQFVATFLGTLGNHLYYTGANDVDSEGNFVYYNSQKPVQSVVWKSGEPNNSGGDEDCTNLNLSGLNDNRCARSSRFVCEIPVV